MSRNSHIKRRVGKRSAAFEAIHDGVVVAGYRVKPSRESGLPEFVVIDEFRNAVVGHHPDFDAAVEDASRHASLAIAH